jgi:hypothetical protein
MRWRPAGEARLEATAMLNWLSKLFRRRDEAQPLPQRRSTSLVRVDYDDRAITVDDGTGGLATIAWGDIGSVTVLTTDAGPFETDLFWIVSDRDGRQSITIPMDAGGEHALLIAMQARLAGFDDMAVVEAMSSTGGGVFRIWPPEALM